MADTSSLRNVSFSGSPDATGNGLKTVFSKERRTILANRLANVFTSRQLICTADICVHAQYFTQSNSHTICYSFKDKVISNDVCLLHHIEAQVIEIMRTPMIQLPVVLSWIGPAWWSGRPIPNYVPSGFAFSITYASKVKKPVAKPSPFSVKVLERDASPGQRKRVSQIVADVAVNIIRTSSSSDLETTPTPTPAAGQSPREETKMVEDHTVEDQQRYKPIDAIYEDSTVVTPGRGGGDVLYVPIRIYEDKGLPRPAASESPIPVAFSQP